MPAQPVRPGTAEHLARLAHFASLDLPEVDELDRVAQFLLGDVGGIREELWPQLKEHEARRLWHLIADDWDDRDLDELTEAQYEVLGLCTYKGEQEARHETTVARLVSEIERAVWLARVAAAGASRSAA